MNWAYLAGFFDGEGSVGLSSSHTYGFSMYVQLAQSGHRGKQMLEKVKEFLATQGISTNKIGTATSKLSTLPAYRLRIGTRKGVTEFLTQVFPHLHIKKLEAQDVLRTLTLFPALPKGGRLTWESRRKNQT